MRTPSHASVNSTLTCNTSFVGNAIEEFTMLPLSPLTAPAVPSPSAATDPLREAAADLHAEFLLRMLEDAGLTEALGAARAGGEAAALSSVALGGLARDMAATQPALTERLYEAMRRGS